MRPGDVTDAGTVTIEWPEPAAAPRRRCARCGHPVRAGRMVQGRYGADCAALLGLVGSAPDTGHDGPDLLDLLGVDLPADEPGDTCDGWDR